MKTKPDFTLVANHANVTDKLFDRVAKLEIIQHSGFVADHCILTLDDHRDHRVDPPKPGDTLRASMGYQGDAWLINQGEYEVAEHAYSGSRDTLTVFANTLHWSKALKAPRQFTWQSLPEAPITLTELVATIAKRYALDARIADVFNQVTIPTIHQSESDAQLLTRLASLYDATARVVERFLVFVPRGTGTSRSGQALETVTVDHQQLIQWEMLDSELPAFTGCQANYHDVLTATRKSVRVGDGELCFEMPWLFADKKAAYAAATARLRDFKRTERTLSATCVGSPTLMAGGTILLRNVRDSIDGEWCLTKVHQIIDTSGFVTHFTAEQLLV